MKEAQTQKEIIDYLEKGGHYVIKNVRTNKVGTPDLVVCTMDAGKFYAIEVKAEGKKKNVTKLQQFHIDLINRTGGTAIVADHVFDVMEIL